MRRPGHARHRCRRQDRFARVYRAPHPLHVLRRSAGDGERPDPAQQFHRGRAGADPRARRHHPQGAVDRGPGLRAHRYRGEALAHPGRARRRGARQPAGHHLPLVPRVDGQQRGLEARRHQRRHAPARGRPHGPGPAHRQADRGAAGEGRQPADNQSGAAPHPQGAQGRRGTRGPRVQLRGHHLPPTTPAPATRRTTTGRTRRPSTRAGSRSGST